MYNFDNVAALGESTGIVKDLSQYTNNGSGYGALTWASNGRRGGSYLFNGSNTYITSATGIALSGNAAFTISAWINRSGNRSTDYPAVVSINPGTTNNGVSMTVKDGRPAIDFRNNRYRVLTGLSSGVRYHITITKAPGAISSTSKIYVNGVEVSGALEGSDTTPAITGNIVNIGRLDATRFFSGQLDEIRIYNRTLSAGEVSNLYNSNLSKYATNRWTFTSVLSGLTEGTYLYSGQVTDLAGNNS